MATAWTPRTKPTTSYTARTKPITSWKERGESAILQENSFNILQENNSLILLESSAPITTSWTKRTKP